MSGIKSTMDYLQSEFNASRSTKEAVSKAYSTYNAVTEAIIAKENRKINKEDKKDVIIDIEDIKKNTESIVIRDNEGER